MRNADISLAQPCVTFSRDLDILAFDLDFSSPVSYLHTFHAQKSGTELSTLAPADMGKWKPS